MPSPRPPSWRDIERAILAVFDEWEITYTEHRGDRYITHRGVEYCISELAKEVEKHL